MLSLFDMKFLVRILFLTFPLPLLLAVQTVVYFASEEALDQKLIARIDEEKNQVLVAVYSFTHQGIAKALIGAKERGVDVQVIVDRFSVKKRSPLRQLVEAGIQVSVWDSEPKRGLKGPRSLMHHKFCIFGGKSVWTGSFNFTYDASRRHCENVVVLEDEKVAQAFKKEFNTLYHRSCLSYASYVALKPFPQNKRGIHIHK